MADRFLQVVMLLLVLQAITFGQDSVPLDDTADDGSLSTIKPSIGTIQEPDFFVVDTSRCPQEPSPNLVGCCGGVSRFLPDKRFHRSSNTELLGAIQPGVPICIVVHGSFVGAGSLYPETVGRYARLIAAANDRPLHFIGSHWPSQISVPVLPAPQASYLGLRAEFNGIYLAQFINTLPAENPVCLIGHSHGCRVVASALHLLGGGRVRGYTVADGCPQRRIRTVLGAAAIDRHWLNPNQRYGYAIRRTECLLNIMNPSDFVLTLYPLQAQYLHEAVGRVGLFPQDLQFMGEDAAKIKQLNISRLVGPGHTISSYAPWPQIRQSMLSYVYFD